MTPARTAACPAWCTAPHAPGGPHQSRHALLDGSDSGLFATAWLTTSSGSPDVPVLRLESDGTSDTEPLDVAGAARFAAAVSEWARHVGYLAELAVTGRGSEVRPDVVAILLPAVLARAEDAWWEARGG
jgi:hypothetical protein